MGPVHYHAGDFPPRDIDGKRLVPRLHPTATAVARYDGMLAAVPTPTCRADQGAGERAKL